MKHATLLSLGAAVFGLVAAAVSVGTAAPAQAQLAGCSLAPTLDPTSPTFLAGDISGFTTTQQTVNCFAWQAFVAMNWPVDPSWPANPDAAGEPDRTVTAAQFGLPRTADGDSRPVVWETFKRAQDVFNSASAAPPAPWGELPGPPSSCAQAKAQDKVLQRRAKAASGSTVENPDRFMQATGNWLVDQDRNVVWYELLTNRAEFEAIVANKWYLTSGQQASLQGGGLSLPTGTRPTGTIQPWDQLGAVELKAAWRILTDQPALWERYYAVEGWTHDPVTGDCAAEVFGLVGLHIIQKTERFNNFMWSTFEQVDTAPSTNDASVPPGGWAFYDAKCSGDACISSTGDVCAAAIEKEGEGQAPHPPPNPDPIQVKRCYPVGNSDQLADLNSGMQAKIAAASGGKSVFQYYQLVNVLWPETPLPPPPAGAVVPLDVSTMTRAGGVPVANITMETFRQDETCTDCHAYASNTVPHAGDSKYATDFSFLFDEAYDDLKAR